MLDYDIDAKALNSSKDDIFDKYNINIIDMSFATPYLDSKSNEHVKK